MIASLLKRILDETQDIIRFHDTKSAILPAQPSCECWLQQARLAADGSAMIDYSIVGQRGVHTEKAENLRLDDIEPIIRYSALVVLDED